MTVKPTTGQDLCEISRLYSPYGGYFTFDHWETLCAIINNTNYTEKSLFSLNAIIKQSTNNKGKSLMAARLKALAAINPIHAVMINDIIQYINKVLKGTTTTTYYFPVREYGY